MPKIVVVGNSASGISACEAIRKKDKASSITVISQEKHPAYNRARLLDYLAQEIKRDDLFYLDSDFYVKNNVELISGKEVVRINEKRRIISLDDKSNLDYDILLLASGAASNIPEIKGTYKYGVFKIRSLDDVEKILEITPVITDVCIIGSGSIGLRAALAFKKRNLDVTVITKSKFALSSYLDEAASSIVRKRLEDIGIRFIFNQDVAEIIGEKEVRAIKLESGKVIASTLVLIAKGSLPNFKFIKDTDIKINKGIIVDENFKTNIPDIYAAGEVCECYNFVLDKFDINRQWDNALLQGEIAGENIIGNLVKYGGFLNSKILDLSGLRCLAAGKTIAAGEPEEKIFFDEKNSTYKKITIKDNKIIGTILIGDLLKKEDILEYMKEKKDISNIKNNFFD